MRVSLTETERKYLLRYCVHQANRVNHTAEGAAFATEGLDKLIAKLDKEPKEKTDDN